MNFNDFVDLGFPDRRKSDDFDQFERKPKIKTGLRNKIIIVITTFVIIMFMSLFVFYEQIVKNIATDVFKSTYSELNYNLAGKIAGYAARGEKEEIVKLWSNLQLLNTVIYIEWINAEGKSEYAAFKEKYQHQIPPWTKELAANHIQYRQYFLASKELIHEFISPLGTQETKVLSGKQGGTGFVRLGIVSNKIVDTYYKNISAALVFLIISILVGLLMAWYLSRIITTPIQQLARAMKLIASEIDELDETGLPIGRRFRRINDIDLNVRTQDETGQLADEFQAMIKKLENSYQKLEIVISEKNQIVQEKSQLAENLRELNRKNEIIIKDRTREVVEKNLRLYEIFEELQFQKEELISMNEQLEKISRMKSEFLASMSHELRTPLNSIIGFAEVLKDKMFGDLNERQDKYLSNILASARHLLQLINNILDISKVEAGKMKLIIEAYSLNRVIDEVQSTIRTLAYKKNILMDAKLSRDVVIQGDVSKIKQILYNLLSNAIKFTDEKGSVTIVTEEIPTGKYFAGGPGSEAFMVEAPSILLIVMDTGIGIKEEDQSRVFQEFEQTDQTRKRKYEGTGLGLALTRKLVNLHGGHIWLESVVEQGTKVYVSLPIKTIVDETDGQEEKE